MLRTHALLTSNQTSMQSDDTCGVCVRSSKGVRLLHRKALELFEVNEREVLRLATYFMEKRSATLEAENAASLILQIDKLQVRFLPYN